MSRIVSSREKKIILLLMNSETDITTQAIANEINVSKRTVLREMPSIYTWFNEHGFEVIKNPNKGLRVNLNNDEKEYLLDLAWDEFLLSRNPIRHRRSNVLMQWPLHCQ